MEKRVALIAVLVKDTNSVDLLNALLHEYGEYIIGRMGIPHAESGLNIISVAVYASSDIVNALTGKIGKIDGISAKTVYSNNV